MVDEVEEVRGREARVRHREEPVQLVHRRRAAQGNDDCGDGQGAGPVDGGEGAGHVEYPHLVEAELGCIIHKARCLRGDVGLRGAQADK